MENNKKETNFMVGLGYSLTQPNFWVCNNNKQLFAITDNFPTITFTKNGRMIMVMKKVVVSLLEVMKLCN